VGCFRCFFRGSRVFLLWFLASLGLGLLLGGFFFFSFVTWLWLLLCVPPVYLGTTYAFK
jgi:hypothetical protein